MKSLQQHIYENNFHKNEISEKLIINKNTQNIDDCFIYNISEKQSIKIFSNGWAQFNDYRNKVYINGEHIELDYKGFTHKKYIPGEYEIKIEDINAVENCDHMFWKCYNLTKVPLFDTRKVESMITMFYECFNLTEVPLFDTRNVKDMRSMFGRCNNLTEVPLFDTRNVESMHQMFCECGNLTQVPLFDTRKVITMATMFYGCKKLNKQTKQKWSQIYDFQSHNKK